MGSVALQRVGGLAKTAQILCGAAGVTSLVPVTMTSTVRDEARDLLADRIDDEAFVEQTAAYLLAGIIPGVFMLAAAVVVIIWMYRVAANHRALHRGTTWGSGWAIGGWFLPPCFAYVIPTLVLHEMWKAADPAIPVGGDWKSKRGSPLPAVWFVVYCVVPVALLFANPDIFNNILSASQDTVAERILASQTIPWINAFVQIAAAGVFIALCRQITSRHRRLTGEAVR